METYRSGWFNLEGYLACSVRYADGSKRTVLQYREVMETHLNRTLSSSEVVHHIDGNKRNNDISNLEVLNRSTHGKHHAKDAEVVKGTCLECGAHILCKASVERRRIKRGVTGPYCNKKCVGRASRKKQIAEGKINLRAMVVK